MRIPVRHQVSDQVATVVLDRPEALNALTPGARDRLIELFTDLSADPEVRAVVLTGTGRGFCAGADLRGGTGAGTPGTPKTPETPGTPGTLGTPGTPDTPPPERVVGDVSRVLRRGAQRLIGAVLDCEKPVIAAVNGTAAGLGAHLAFACDLVLAAESARFIEVFVRRGLVPDAGGAYLLPRLIGPRRAKELMFFGDALSAADAERLGLVNRVIADDELAATAGQWAARLASGPTRALALTKQLVDSSLESDRAAAFAAEAAAQELNMATRDAQEGIRCFVTRETPRFRGR
ncbi:enoyl-CoA hydratase-related protein [Streptomyces sp. MAA16]|uniref:enoyl-CoA hydratase/isomerase family protein n=1 Tax=Streptomyces sp. MAA16 TaxID=3035116 RepID=UPI002476739C|nr:enoyl-CoA hydratase-related protein [Streptomyces sp. MAA16]MDH6699915.1 2-(1,2-epoxy-1,2-dihydrophenyl)acetyl-CoA isomerase [Streptomyces sp. MAA16]